MSPRGPDARPDDGRLDAVALLGGGLARWPSLAVDIVTRRPARGRLYRVRCHRLEVTLAHEEPREADGEVIGSARELTVVAEPGVLALMTPRAAD